MLGLRGCLSNPVLTPTPTNRRHDDQGVREPPRPRTMRQRTTRLMTLFSEAKQTNQSAIRPAEPSSTRHTIHPLAMHAFATAPPPFADPLSTLALPLQGPFVYVLDPSILHRRTGYAVPAFTNSLLAAWCTAPIRSDPHRTHPIESDLTGPDRMGPQPTSGARAAWLPFQSRPHAHANQPST